MSAAATRPAGGAEQAGERGVRRFVTVLAVVVGGLCFLFSAGNVYHLAVDLGLWAWIRPLVAPAVDLSLVALVVGIRFLARRGLSGQELRRPRAFMLAVGLAAWALNTAGAVAQRDWGKAAFDSLAPGLLVGWAEVLPWFLRQFHAVTHPTAEPSAVLVPVPADGEDATPGTVPAPAPAKPAPVPKPGAVPAPGTGDGAGVGRSQARQATRSRPTTAGTGAAAPAELAQLARTAAAAYEAEHGRPISRDALRRALHVSNRVAGELLRAVRAPTAVPPAVQVPPAGGTAAEPGPVPVASPVAGNGDRPTPGDQPAPATASPSRTPARVP